MNQLHGRRWMGALGIVACVLLIAAFPFSYAFIRNVMLRRSAARKTSPRGLLLLDKVDLYLDQELNKRLRGLGVGLYRLTGGRITQLYQASVLLLTTRGRRSGKMRTVLLQFFPEHANLVLVAANSGRPVHPDWFYNLKATPTAHVQIMGRTLEVHAEELSTEEASAFWPHVLQVAPSYARYQQAASRPLPLVRLVPALRAEEQTGTPGEALPGQEQRPGITAGVDLP